MSNRQSFFKALECFADPLRRNDYFHLYTDDVIVHGYQGIEPGLESVKQFYRAFWKVFPDARVVAQDLIGEGDTLVARYTITGTLHGILWALPRPDNGSNFQGSAFCISGAADALSDGPAQTRSFS